MDCLLAEKVGMKTCFAPVDMDTAAITGARIKLAEGQKVAFVLSMGTSAASTVEATLKQHNAASGGTSKDLTSAKPYFHKIASATSFTKVTPTSEAALKDLSSIFSTVAGLVVIEVDASELDINNGYAWFSVNLADTGAAKLGSGVYLLHDMSHLPATEIDL